MTVVELIHPATAEHARLLAESDAFAAELHSLVERYHLHSISAQWTVGAVLQTPRGESHAVAQGRVDGGCSVCLGTSLADAVKQLPAPARPPFLDHMAGISIDGNPAGMGNA